MHNKIPANIITGFLGVGKTTAIMHLLGEKKADEVWAVLVNEFGEIGIDGAMLKTANAHVREVPGGCICCVAGLPMKIALNMMIATTKPDRIIIEPTGLGHPAEIIQILTGEYYQDVLDLRATITLVDPRKLADKRYSENTTFQDQLAVADSIVANKTDLCAEAEQQQFNQLLQSFAVEKNHGWVEQGRLDPAWLDLPRQPRDEHNRRGSQSAGRESRLSPRRDAQLLNVKLPVGENFIRRENSGDGFYSCGWMFRPDWQFDFNLLFLWMTGVPFIRVKAVINTGQGFFIFNSEEGVLSVNQLDAELEQDMLDSRIELIHNGPIDGENLEQQLLALVASTQTR